MRLATRPLAVWTVLGVICTACGGAPTTGSQIEPNAPLDQTTPSTAATSNEAPSSSSTPPAPDTHADSAATITAPRCDTIPDMSDADACEVGTVISGNLDEGTELEWLVELRLRYGTRNQTSWYVLRGDGERFATVRALYDAEGFTPRTGSTLTIAERRIVGQGAWDCADCGCTEGQASIELAVDAGETVLRIDRARTRIDSEPPVCDGP